jgi:hypothetical protein
MKNMIIGSLVTFIATGVFLLGAIGEIEKKEAQSGFKEIDGKIYLLTEVKAPK